MKGYKLPLKPPVMVEVGVLAHCLHCGHTWIEKRLTSGAVVNSCSYDACDDCYDAEKEEYRPGAYTPSGIEGSVKYEPGCCFSEEGKKYMGLTDEKKKD